MKNSVNYENLPLPNRKIYDLVMKHTGGNVTSFAAMIGISQQRVNRIFNIDTRSKKYPSISSEIKSAVMKKFCIDEVWFLLEDSECIEPTSKKEEQETTMLLPTLARGGTLADFSQSVNEYECERIISPVKGAEFAITVTGDSMSPEYPSGSRVFIKQINERAFIDWGRVYVLDTCNGTIIKKIMPGSNSECVRCISINSEYPDFEVQFSDMHGMYRILALLTEK